MQKQFACLLLAGVTALGFAGGAQAAQVDSDSAYCFSARDFNREQEPISGICLTGLPGEGTVMLGSRVLRAGDILTAPQLEKLTFFPAPREQDGTVQMCYLPIYENKVEKQAELTISIRGKEDLAPVAQDSSLETYRDLENSGKLKARDPEGKALIFTLGRAPRRGSVELHEDGTFTYTPKKRRVGVDSFTFTAADPAGHVSREATVTIQILKPTDSTRYTDTEGSACRFEAEWLRSTGLFEGERVGGKSCFFPDRPVSRGQFLAMLTELLDMEQDTHTAAIPQDTPRWLRPYLAAAIRSGLTDGLPFAMDTRAPITGAEAAVMLQNVLDLSVSEAALETALTEKAQGPHWAVSSLTVLREHGIDLTADAPLTRAETAQVLYKVSTLALSAPGTAVFR